MTGPLRIWGYQWMVRELVCGLAREYLPLLRHHRCFDDDLGRALLRALPNGWEGWSAVRVHDWLTVFAMQVAWLQTTDDRPPTTALSSPVVGRPSSPSS